MIMIIDTLGPVYAHVAGEFNVRKRYILCNTIINKLNACANSVYQAFLFPPPPRMPGNKGTTEHAPWRPFPLTTNTDSAIKGRPNCGHLYFHWCLLFLALCVCVCVTSLQAFLMDIPTGFMLKVLWNGSYYVIRKRLKRACCI